MSERDFLEAALRGRQEVNEQLPAIQESVQATLIARRSEARAERQQVLAKQREARIQHDVRVAELVKASRALYRAELALRRACDEVKRTEWIDDYDWGIPEDA